MIQHTIQSGGGGIARLALLLATFGGATAVAPAQDTTGFNEAVGSTGLEWRTGGDSAWFVEEDEASSNGYVLRSGPIGDSQQTWVELETEGPARLSFRMKYDTELNNDVVSVNVWEAATSRTHTLRSGSRVWTTYSLDLTDPINNRVRWSYTKNESESVGEDAVWIDDIDLTVFDYDWSVVPHPSSVSGHATVYDAARGRHVLFGGQLETYSSDQTFEFNGTYWVKSSAPLGPSARHSHAMVYDSLRERVLLFGGESRPTPSLSLALGDIWEYDGDEWTEIRTPITPPPRFGHGMVYDSDRDRVILFGGFGENPLNDMWEFDGTEWKEIIPLTVPSPRFAPRMAYDESRGRVVLFGDRTQPTSGVLLGDTWEFDGFTWLEIDTPVSPPPATDPAIAYDHVKQQVILVDRAVWRYDSGGWHLVDDRQSYGFRRGATLTYDTREESLVLFGGTLSTSLHGTWVYSYENWAIILPGPKAGAYPKMVNDPLRNRTIFFGEPRLSSTSTNTWEYDGVGWRSYAHDVSPGPRSEHAMVWDATAGHLFLFGGVQLGHNSAGRTSDMWRYDGESWNEIQPEGPVPAPRSAHAMAHDPIRKMTVLFGGHNGQNLGDTMVWDGYRWSEIQTENAPSARRHHAMLFSPHRGTTILLGGIFERDGTTTSTWMDDAWEFDGTDWRELPDYRLPNGMHSFGCAIHPETGEIVVVGRSIAAGRPVTTWIHDGTQWSLIETRTRPMHIDGAPLSYSSADAKFLQFAVGYSTSYRLTKVDRSPPSTPTPTPSPSPSPTPTPTVTTAVPTTVTPTITVTATPSPTETSTPVPTTNVPTATATATATPSPTPTATTPVATPTVTPISPELVEALSSLTAENWNPVTVPEVYAEPSLEYVENTLRLFTNSNNTFGFYTTRQAIGPLGAGRYHLLASIVPTGELPVGGAFPELRLRVTGENGLVNFLRADASTGSSTEARSVSAFFGGSDGGLFGVSVDILRFIENQAGGYAVTAFQLEPVAGAAATVESPALEIVEGNWASTAFDGIFASPEFMQTGEGLLVSTNAAGTFGFWSSTNTLGPLEPGLYELVATVEPQGELAGGESYPELRLRVTGNAGLVNVLRADAATGASTGPRELSVLFEATSDADSFGVAVDILRFLDSQRGGYLITDFVLKRIE